MNSKNSSSTIHQIQKNLQVNQKMKQTKMKITATETLNLPKLVATFYE